MVSPVTPDMLDPNTPDDVMIRAEARRPVTDPTLGIPVSVNSTGKPRHRLVAIGDSLTHGFQSGAIFKTNISHPVLIARELGWDRQLRYPTYDGPGDGLPLNLENLANRLDQKFGSNIDIWELPSTLLFLRQYLDDVEDYWERGEGSRPSAQGPINHNLAVYGWDLRNTISRTAETCQQILNQNPPKDDFLKEVT